MTIVLIVAALLFLSTAVTVRRLYKLMQTTTDKYPYLHRWYWAQHLYPVVLSLVGLCGCLAYILTIAFGIQTPPLAPGPVMGSIIIGSLATVLGTMILETLVRDHILNRIDYNNRQNLVWSTSFQLLMLITLTAAIGVLVAYMMGAFIQ